MQEKKLETCCDRFENSNLKVFFRAFARIKQALLAFWKKWKYFEVVFQIEIVMSYF